MIFLRLSILGPLQKLGQSKKMPEIGLKSNIISPKFTKYYFQIFLVHMFFMISTLKSYSGFGANKTQLFYSEYGSQQAPLKPGVTAEDYSAIASSSGYFSEYKQRYLTLVTLCKK